MVRQKNPSMAEESRANAEFNKLAVIERPDGKIYEQVKSRVNGDVTSRVDVYQKDGVKGFIKIVIIKRLDGTLLAKKHHEGPLSYFSNNNDVWLDITPEEDAP